MEISTEQGEDRRSNAYVSFAFDRRESKRDHSWPLPEFQIITVWLQRHPATWILISQRTGLRQLGDTVSGSSVVVGRLTWSRSRRQNPARRWTTLASDGRLRVASLLLLLLLLMLLDLWPVHPRGRAVAARRWLASVRQGKK